MARTRCYHQGNLVDENFAIELVSEHLDEPDTLVWVDLCAPEDAELKMLAAELGLHALAVEDAIHLQQRPKLDRYPDHSFMSAYFTRFDIATTQLTTSEIAVFVTTRSLITIRQDDELDIEAVVRRWDSSPDLAKNGVAFLLHGLLDYLVDGYFDVVQSLDDEIETLEDQLFLPNSDQGGIQRRSYELRKSLVLLRRVVLPMREVVNTLLRRDLHLVDEAMGPYFQDVYDHVLRATEWTDSLRDLVSSILESNLVMQGNQLGVITKKVTSYAAIIAVPTAVTGFYGQNLPYPGFSQNSGLYASSALIIGLSALLFFLFRRNDWL